MTSDHYSAAADPDPVPSALPHTPTSPDRRGGAQRTLDPGQRNGLLAAVDTDCLRTLHRHMERVRLKRGEILINTEAPLTRIWFPETCVVALVIQMEDGSSAEVAEVGREGAVGHEAVLGVERSVIQAAVQVSGEALCIRTRHLLASMEHSTQLRLAMWHNMASIHAQAMQSAACYALHSTRARLARFLLLIQDRTDQPAMHLTQELLAEMLGVQRTTVTAAALALMDEGLILYRRGRIDICNRAGLEAAACECYEAFRQFCHHTLPPLSRWA